jgi:uncharacterized protein YqiB (DUF1249 family)
MTAINQYERNYEALQEILGNLDPAALPENLKLKSGGFMDLNFDHLGGNRIALSHYYKHPSDDMIADPDMEIRILHELKAIEALTYQDSFGYRAVYPEPGRLDRRAKLELNQFLTQWLKNLKAQGFKHEPGNVVNTKEGR